MKKVLKYISILFVLSVFIGIKNVYAYQSNSKSSKCSLVVREICNDVGCKSDNKYNSTSGGYDSSGGKYGNFDKYSGYYFARKRKVDLGRVFTLTDNQYISFALGLNHCDASLYSSVDGVHWDHILNESSNISGYTSEWKYRNLNSQECRGRKVRYFKLEATKMYDGTSLKDIDNQLNHIHYSAIDDLYVCLWTVPSSYRIKYHEKESNSRIELDGDVIEDKVVKERWPDGLADIPKKTEKNIDIKHYICDNPGTVTLDLKAGEETTYTFYYKKIKVDKVSCILSGYQYRGPNSKKCWVQPNREVTVDVVAGARDYPESVNLYLKNGQGRLSYSEWYGINGYTDGDITDYNVYSSQELKAYYTQGYPLYEKSLKCSFKIKALDNQDGQHFNLFGRGKIYDVASYSQGENEEKELWIDGRAPTGNVKIENCNPLGFDVVIDNVSDNGGSGVNRVKVKEYSLDHGDDDSPAHIFTKRIFKNLLGREADKGGLDWYVNLLESNEKSELDVVLNCINSQEFNNKHISNEEYVNAMFRIFLNREADQSGYNYWLTKINNRSIDKAELARKFYESDEFITKQINGRATKNVNGKWTYHVSTKEHKNEYGKYQVQVYTYDNVSNTACIKDMEVDVPYPKPICGNLEVKKYDYKESDTKYWSKPESTYCIYTESYFDGNLGLYPTGTSLAMREDDNKNVKDVMHTLNIDNDYDEFENSGHEYINNYCNDDDINNLHDDLKNKNFKKASKYFDNNKNRNYINGYHLLNSDTDSNGHKFKLYSQGKFTYETESNYGTCYSDKTDSGIWLMFDGTAPQGNVDMSMDEKTLNISVNASNVIDYCGKKKEAGSGVKKLYVEYKPSEGDQIYDDGSSINAKYQDLKYNETNKTWNTVIDAYAAFKCDDLDVNVHAVDNVGNDAIIYSKKFQLFTLKAHIVPFNDKESTAEIPNILEGQYGILKIVTTGGPTHIDIEFPYELTDHIQKGDKKLDYSFDIPEQVYYKNEYEFKVPLYVEHKEYEVNVTAKKKLNSKTAIPKFNVSDSVLNGIRTRIR